ncbi:MAG: hypothetical protein H0V09_01310 [Gemmatimonadetes bacterium]|nr:hypothetical protein [Gemmatimonadota bacterium]
MTHLKTCLAWAFVLAFALVTKPAWGQAPAGPGAAEDEEEESFTEDFMLENCRWSTRGANPFFILEPGYRLVLEGIDDGENTVKFVTVTDRTLHVGGVETRVVLEREFIDGELYEVARNYFAICQQTNSVFYFGEDVDFYEDGQIIDHHGSWRAGVGGAKPGVIMPGTLLLGARYYQEIAPRVALDRAEIESLNAVIQTPFGRFRNCLRTEETTPLEPGLEEIKLYARGIGLVKDGPLRLVQATYVNAAE